jgi:hypothetical protein
MGYKLVDMKIKLVDRLCRSFLVLFKHQGKKWKKSVKQDGLYVLPHLNHFA